MTKEITELSQHIVLYSKHWYKKSNDNVKDLQILISKFCLLDIKYVSIKDVYDVVSEAFVESSSQKEYRELLRRIFYQPYEMKKKKATKHNLINEMLNLMSCIQTRNKDEILITLCEPNYTYLPERSKEDVK